MTVAQYAPTITRGSSRWLLLGSLALNLFFVGVAVAMAVRAPAPPAWDRNVFVRVEHIADTLPPADADLLRGQINANRQLIDEAQIAIPLRAGRDPRDAAARAVRRRRDARGHGEDPRRARQAFDQVIQGVFAFSASQMSPAGRKALADWPPGRKTASNRQ